MSKKWQNRNKMRQVDRKALQVARQAVLDYFNETYGNDVNNLDAWQKLCGDVEVTVGATIDECQEGLKVYLNIMDFVIAKKDGKPVHKYDTEDELRKYIKRWHPKKTFPLNRAVENPILEWMLIVVFGIGDKGDKKKGLKPGKGAQREKCAECHSDEGVESKKLDQEESEGEAEAVFAEDGEEEFDSETHDHQIVPECHAAERET